MKSREELGRIVREVWVEWAKEQQSPKPSWLVPWEGLGEPDKEVDRRIGERLAAEGNAEIANPRKPLEFEQFSKWAYRATLLPALGVWLWVDYVTPETHHTSRRGWVFRLLGLSVQPT